MIFASRPTYAGKEFVYEDDARLGGGTPTSVAAETTFLVPADKQTIAFVPIRIEGTLIIDGTVVNL